MTAQLDRDIDALYQGPPADFTASRAALAKSLSGDAARQVRSLKKPTVVPWAVSQVYWRARPAYDRVIKLGHALRTAQIAALKGKKADLRAASDAHRAAVSEAVRRAAELASESGLKPNAEAVGRMFEAISLAATPPENAGRFTEVIEPSGFEALTGVKPVGGSRERREAVEKKPTRRDRGAERQRAEEERRRAKQVEATLRKATATLDRARARAAAARETLDRAEAEVAAAEREVAKARKAGTSSGAKELRS